MESSIIVSYEKEDNKILDVFASIIVDKNVCDNIERLKSPKIANKYAFIDTTNLSKLHVYSRIMRFFNKPKRNSVRLLNKGIEIRYCSICTAVTNIKAKYPVLYNNLLNKIEAKQFITREEEMQLTQTLADMSKSRDIPPKNTAFKVTFKNPLIDKYKELKTENEYLRQENLKLKREKESFMRLPSIKEFMSISTNIQPIVHLRNESLPPTKKQRKDQPKAVSSN
jgi:hypothetical protein